MTPFLLTLNRFQFFGKKLNWIVYQRRVVRRMSYLAEQDDALTAFYEQAENYINSYDDAVYMNIARTIVRILVTGLEKPLSDKEHPFHAYGSFGCHAQNVANLANKVREQINNDERKIAVAFFHPGGSQRNTLNEFMEYYYYDLVEEFTDLPRTPIISEVSSDEE